MTELTNIDKLQRLHANHLSAQSNKVITHLLSELLSVADVSVDRCVLSSDENFVEVFYSDGFTKTINVKSDNQIALIKDVINNI